MIIFTFTKAQASLKPQGQLQTNLSQNIFAFARGLDFFSNEWPWAFTRDDESKL